MLKIVYLPEYFLKSFVYSLTIVCGLHKSNHKQSLELSPS